MSGLSTQVSEKIGIPTMPELIYVPLLFFLRNNFSFRKSALCGFGGWFCFWFLLLVISILFGRFETSAVISTARAYLFLFAFFVIVRNVNINQYFLEAVFFSSFGSIIGWFLSISLKFLGYFPMTLDMVTYGNMMAIPICLALLFSHFLKWKYAIPIISMLVFISFTAALRRQILVTAVSLMICLILYLIKTKSKKVIVVSIFTAMAFTALFPLAESAVEEFSPVLYHRVFEKSRSFLSDEDDLHEDEVRLNNFVILKNTLGESIIPHGFVSKRAMKDETVGIFVDNPLIELCYTFSIFLAIAFVFNIIKKGITAFIMYMKTYDSKLMFCIVTGSILFLLLFIDGTNLTYTYNTPFSGIVIGLLFRYGSSKYKNNF